MSPLQEPSLEPLSSCLRQGLSLGLERVKWDRRLQCPCSEISSVPRALLLLLFLFIFVVVFVYFCFLTLDSGD